MTEAERKEAGRILRSISAVTLAGSLAVVVLEVLRLVFRNNQLFCPSREPLIGWNPADYGLDPRMVDDIVFESDDGTVLHGWYCRTERPIASVLYCHGNTGNITYSASCIPQLVESGLNVFIFDYRGFGRSAAFPTLAGVIQDAEAAAREHHAMRPHDVPSILYGYSLGGAIAAQTAQHVYFDGMILQSTFTNLADMAKVKFPRLPMHLLSGHDFNTLDIVRRLRIPLVVIHGTNDEVIPSWMGQSLYKSCETAQDIHLINGAMHTDLWERDAEGIVDFIARFALTLRKGGAPEPIEEIEPPTVVDRLFAAVRRSALLRRNSGLRPVIDPDHIAAS